jgi:hypothetical protein
MYVEEKDGFLYVGNEDAPRPGLRTATTEEVASRIIFFKSNAHLLYISLHFIVLWFDV